MMVRGRALGLALGLCTLAAWPASGQTVRQLPPGQSAPAPDPETRQPRSDRHADQGRPADRAGRDAPSIATSDTSGGATSFDAKFNGGMAAIRAKNPGKAVELLRPVLTDFERYADATAVFQRLVGFAPQSSRYLNELGYVLMKQKKFGESRAAYRRSEAAADLTPGRGKEVRCIALIGMGYDLVELGDLDAAEAAYRKCLNVDPADKDSPNEIDYIQKQRKLTV